MHAKPNPFAHLSEQEKQLLIDALPYITLLIASADGSIDDKEIQFAEKLAYIRSYLKDNPLHEIYADAAAIMDQRIKDLLSEAPEEYDQRIAFFSEKLAQLNDVLAKLDIATASELYKSWRTFALQIAKASGGFLGAFSVTKEEEELAKLPMIKPPM